MSDHPGPRQRPTTWEDGLARIIERTDRPAQQATLGYDLPQPVNMAATHVTPPEQMILSQRQTIEALEFLSDALASVGELLGQGTETVLSDRLAGVGVSLDQATAMSQRVAGEHEVMSQQLDDISNTLADFGFTPGPEGVRALALCLAHTAALGSFAVDEIMPRYRGKLRQRIPGVIRLKHWLSDIQNDPAPPARRPPNKPVQSGRFRERVRSVQANLQAGSIEG